MNKTTFILSLTQCLTLEHRVGRGEMRFLRWSSYIRDPVLPHHPEVDLGLQVDVLHHVE